MTHAKPKSPHELLTAGMTRFQRRLCRRLVAETLQEFAAFRASVRRSADASDTAGSREGKLGFPLDRRLPENAAARMMLDFLRHHALDQLNQLKVLAASQAEFRRTYAAVAETDESKHVLLDYLAELGGGWWRRLGDRRALKRWLNDEAVNDRFHRRRGERELRLQFVLDRLGVTLDLVASQMESTKSTAGLWGRLSVEALVREALDYRGDRRIRVAALRCLEQSLRHLTPSVAGSLLDPELQRLVRRFATDTTADPWLQCAAIDVLGRIDDDAFGRTLVHRLTHPAAGDDIFVRRHCIRRAVTEWRTIPDVSTVWAQLLSDPSPAVRQQMAASLWQLPPALAWPQLTRLMAADACPQVRAAALLHALDAFDCATPQPRFLKVLAQRLAEDGDRFCQRTALHVAVEWLRRWRQTNRSSQANAEVEQMYASHVMPALARLEASADEIPRRRWAAAAAEQLWVLLDPDARQLYARLMPYLQRMRQGWTRRIPANLLQNVDPDTLGRVLAVLSQEDFGLEAVRGWWGYRFVRQPQFGLRIWRVWSEFWHPATDKRQAYRHTIGRIAHGRLRAPSRILGELSATKVPGEPLVISEDGTWRPFLPLVDDFVSALNQSLILPRTTRLYSSEGITEIRVSRNPIRRIRAGLTLVTRFPAFAELRNWDAKSSQAPERYLQALHRAGFDVSFRPHRGRPQDNSVTQFFPALVAIGMPTSWPLFWDLIESYTYYFSSAFENTLHQLVVFTAAALGLFLAKHAVSNLRIWMARRNIPLSIGGWGTRGKSGTERLKAALFTGIGHPLVSKTTGCEAMFIQGDAYGEPLEIPLYRPADKATIWEQSNLLGLAAGMKPSVFLWECMALTPDYVDVLQQQWMHDDLATITNTYPDHEDLQGPSGLDVATTITGFVPRRSHLLTTEQQMLPLIRQRCQERSTTLRGVSWLDSGLITDDILERFPYREHPDNIALVAAMADELGCDYDFALKAMADHLIPDLGVLKTHPRADVQSCQLEFTNGMSANERFGCLGNWKRLGFDQQEFHRDPTVMISTVVNNRADRVARSRVFASVLVNDLSADRHFLIGGNLKGLQGFIWESWSEFERSITLRRDGGRWDPSAARQTLRALAKRFRVPDDDAQMVIVVRQMIQGSLPGRSADEIEGMAQTVGLSPEVCGQQLRAAGTAEMTVERAIRHLQRLRRCKQQFDELDSLLDRAHDAAALEQLEAKLRRTLKEWFAQKLIVVENYDASGDDVIQRIIDETPPGHLNRVMGIQNIKGTGLDFVYRFHAWDTCHQACEMLTANDPDTRTTALDLLTSLPDFGLLCQQKLQQTLDSLQQANPPLPASTQLQLAGLQQKLEASREVSQRRCQRQDSNAARSTHPAVLWGIGKLEQWMEVQDAVRRRKQADQIYRDLRYERIGRQRAIEELRRLNKRQKGGWLASKLLSDKESS